MEQLYLWINLGSVIGPFILSFDKKVAFYKQWKFLFPAIFGMAVMFIIWDALFAKYGIWGFTPAYLLGLDLFYLPLEEWLFFITIPYCCFFIYECVNAYFKKDLIKPIVKPLLLILSVILFVIGIINYNKLYTSITFITTAIFLWYHIKVNHHYLSNFILGYFITLIPFLLVNGLLTGNLIPEPIVWYNSDHILNLRIITIPVEDTIYNLLMLLTVVTIYEKLKDAKTA